MTDYKALYEATKTHHVVVENAQLRQENSMLRDLIQNKLPVGCIAETTYQPILDENEKLKNDIDGLLEEIKKLKKEDDQMEDTLSSLNFYMEANQELKKEIKEIKKKSMKSISKLGKEKKDLKKQLDSQSN
tara:strand:- start:44 stop:436 length:393 start_codon:yes stop_codon:yes gene_type:complete